jgi:hypothetical protein
VCSCSCSPACTFTKSSTKCSRIAARRGRLRGPDFAKPDSAKNEPRRLPRLARIRAAHFAGLILCDRRYVCACRRSLRLPLLTCPQLRVSSPDLPHSLILANKSCEKYPMKRPAKIARSSLCESGGIGRRTRLRIWRVKPWGFKSPLSHQLLRADLKSALFSLCPILCPPILA